MVQGEVRRDHSLAAPENKQTRLLFANDREMIADQSFPCPVGALAPMENLTALQCGAEIDMPLARHGLSP
jgi:hypothetical protein